MKPIIWTANPLPLFIRSRARPRGGCGRRWWGPGVAPPPFCRPLPFPFPRLTDFDDGARLLALLPALLGLAAGRRGGRRGGVRETGKTSTARIGRRRARPRGPTRPPRPPHPPCPRGANTHTLTGRPTRSRSGSAPRPPTRAWTLWLWAPSRQRGGGGGGARARAAAAVCVCASACVGCAGTRGRGGKKRGGGVRGRPAIFRHSAVSFVPGLPSARALSRTRQGTPHALRAHAPRRHGGRRRRRAVGGGVQRAARAAGPAPAAGGGGSCA